MTSLAIPHSGHHMVTQHPGGSADPALRMLHPEKPRLTHTRVHTCTCTHTHTHAPALTHMHTHTHAPACTHACAFTHMHTHTCTHARAFTHMHMHTSTHSRSLKRDLMKQGVLSSSGTVWQQDGRHPLAQEHLCSETVTPSYLCSAPSSLHGPRQLLPPPGTVGETLQLPGSGVLPPQPAALGPLATVRRRAESRPEQRMSAGGQDKPGKKTMEPTNPKPSLKSRDAGVITQGTSPLWPADRQGLPCGSPGARSPGCCRNGPGFRYTSTRDCLWRHVGP